ncbi:MAG: hypothetical protein LBM27_01255 [Lactobacillaceae bacterium]|jgi:SAM-dependent methyltransferase|nr:hypothetical protein [Lactobacillaceae bacterium]
MFTKLKDRIKGVIEHSCREALGPELKEIRTILLHPKTSPKSLLRNVGGGAQILDCFLSENGESALQTDFATFFRKDHVIGKQSPKPLVCTSQLCNQEFFNLPLFQYWVYQLKDRLILHRKIWEYVYITQTLFENGMLVPGKKGLGFACGTEPLPSLFAKYGCSIVATDLNSSDPRSQEWIRTHENSQNCLGNLNERSICSKADFERLVSFRPLDMNEIPNDLYGKFDFNWSACAVEHIGGLEKSVNFLIENLKTLKKGGIAVHTSEFNLSSLTETSIEPNCIIFRKKDVERVIDKISSLGNDVFPINFKIGNYLADNYVDMPPYATKGAHLRLLLNDFVTTSFGLIVRKG